MYIFLLFSKKNCIIINYIIIFQEALGDVVYAELPTIGTEVKIKGILVYFIEIGRINILF